MEDRLEELGEMISKLNRENKLSTDDQLLNTVITLINLLKDKNIITNEEYMEELYEVTKSRMEDEE
jgi:calcineurin-like phosphoesterase family protein